MYYSQKWEAIRYQNPDGKPTDYLAHHGVKGQKWGVRRYQNPDGTHTPLGRARDRARDRKRYSPKDTVFMSGKVSYDKPLDQNMKNEIDLVIKSNAQIIIGDAPGADTRIQEYLAEKGYSNVIVYTTDEHVRNNVGDWEVRHIDGGGNTEERLIRRQKDIAMTSKATRGLAIMPEDDRPDSATSLNVERLKDSGLKVRVYDYKKKQWV